MECGTILNKKLILWTIVLFSLIPGIFASTVTDAHGEEIGSSGAGAADYNYGECINFTEATAVSSVGFLNGFDGDIVRVFRYGGSEIITTSTTIDGDYFTFSPNFDVNTSTEYCFGLGTVAPATAHTRKYDATIVGYPYVGTRATFTTSFYVKTDLSGWASDYTSVMGITNITTITEELSVTIDYPTNGTTYNDYTGWVNATTSMNVTDCFINDTAWSVNVSTNDTCKFHNADYASLYDGIHTLNLTALGEADSTNASTTVTFTIDTTSPNAASNMSNGTYTTSNFSLSITYTDNLQVYSYNVSLNGNLLYNTSGLSGTTVLYNTTITAANLSTLGIDIPSVVNISTTVCDAHTAQEISDFNVYKIGDKINFDDVWIKSSSKVENIKTERSIDRYSFTFEYSEAATKKTFTLPQSCDYIENSQFPAHFVCGSKWVDFSGKYGITVNGHEVTATSLVPTKVWTFNSVGELNCNLFELGDYYIYNTTSTSTADVIEQTSQTFTLRIDYPYGADNITAALLYNGTSYTGTRTNGTGYSDFTASVTIPIVQSVNYTHGFFWNYTIGDLSTYLQTNDENQTTYEIIVNNCSTIADVYTLNITFLNETTDTWVNVDFEGTFDLWVDGYSYFTNYSYEINSINTTNLCIYPHWASYQTNAQIIYDGFNYNLWNYTLDNITNSLTLYTTDGTTVVTFTVVDEDDEPVADVIIKVLQYDVGTGTFSTTEVLNTDSDGQAIGHIILNTEWYKFILELDGVIVLETEETIIQSTTKTFRITLGEDYFIDYDVVRGIAGRVVFTNSSLTFDYVYTDPTGGIAQACLEVIKRTINGDTTLSSQCSSSTAGTISYTIVEDVGSNTYIATGTVIIDGDSFFIDSATAKFGGLWRDYGTDGMFMAFLISVALVMVGIWNPVISIVFLLLAILVSNLLGFFFLNWIYLISLFLMGGIAIFKLTRR